MTPEPPGHLAGLAVVAEVNALRLSWTGPDMTGKPPITGYEVQYKVITATAWSAHPHSGASTSTTVPGLTPGSRYNVRVRARNDAGSSVWASAQSTPAAPPIVALPPGAPTNFKLTPGYSSLRLSWNMPDMTGKPPIIRYEVQYKLSIDEYWVYFRSQHGGVRRVTIDFIGDLSYDVRVRAVNSEGYSDWVSATGTPK